MLPTIKRKNISEQVVIYLQDYIIVNSLQPGDRLPTEASLADQLGVSRSSVREAVKVLESSGIIQVRPRDGIRVRQVGTQHLTDHLKLMLRLDGVSLREMASARQEIEKAFITMIVQHADADDFCRMKAAIQRGREQTERGESSTAADLDFHLALARATKNRVMIGLGGMLYEFFAALRGQVSPDKGKQRKSLDEHQQLLDALQAGEIAAAQHIMDIHLSGYERFPEG